MDKSTAAALVLFVSFISFIAFLSVFAICEVMESFIYRDTDFPEEDFEDEEEPEA